MARQVIKQVEPTSRLRDFLSFVGWVGLLVALGLFLNAVFGPPHLPKPLPTWRDVWSTLGSSEVPAQAIIYFCFTTAWLLLGYLAAITVLRLAVDLAFAVSSGSTAARRLLTWSNLITIPIVRRLVDGMIVTVTVVHLLGPEIQPTPALAAPAALVLDAERHDPWSSATSRLASMRMQPQRVEAAEDGKTVVYLVKKGDTLRGIAQRFLGDEAKWTVIWEANRDKPMGRGLRFTNPDLVYPGWELAIPVGEAPQYEVYTVVEGDSLWGIAEEQLGDGLKWRTIWGLNEGRVMNDGIGFGDPRLIHPGWQLFLPKPPQQVASPAQAPAAREPATPPTPAAQPDSHAPTDRQPPSQATAVPERAVTPTPHAATAPPATPAVSAPLTPTASAQSPTPTPTPAASGTAPVVVLPDGHVVAATFGVALVGLLGYLYGRRRRGAELDDEAAAGYAPGPLVSTLRQRFTEGLGICPS